MITLDELFEDVDIEHEKYKFLEKGKEYWYISLYAVQIHISPITVKEIREMALYNNFTNNFEIGIYIDCDDRGFKHFLNTTNISTKNAIWIEGYGIIVPKNKYLAFKTIRNFYFKKYQKNGMKTFSKKFEFYEKFLNNLKKIN